MPEWQLKIPCLLPMTLPEQLVLLLAVGGFQVQYESYSPSWVGQFLNTRALLIAMTVLASAGVLVIGSCFYCTCQRRRGRVRRSACIIFSRIDRAVGMIKCSHFQNLL